MLLPENSEHFKIIVLGKIKTYCDTNIWPFDYDKFTGWLKNFDCKIEEYLALQILDSLVVRSNEMAIASYSRLFVGSLRQYVIEQTSIDIGTIPSWKTSLKRGTLNKNIRFSPVKKKNDEGESGSNIYRMISGLVETNRYSFAKSKNAPKLLILVDDVIGSGDQFTEFAVEFDLANKLDSYQIVYCPLIGFEKGISRIKDLYPKLNILPCEQISESNALFYGSDDDLFKNDPINTIADARSFLLEMKGKYGPKMAFWFGHNDVAVPLSFGWGCPNQTPSILYMEHSTQKNGWSRLFNRRA